MGTAFKKNIRATFIRRCKLLNPRLKKVRQNAGSKIWRVVMRSFIDYSDCCLNIKVRTKKKKNGQHFDLERFFKIEYCLEKMSYKICILLELNKNILLV